MSVFVTNRDVFVLIYYYSSNNLQLRLHRLIQQVNRLLEPFILDECRIRLLCCLDRGMTEKMLNIGNCSTSTYIGLGGRFGSEYSPLLNSRVANVFLRL